MSTRVQAIIEKLVQIEAACGSFDDFSESYYQKIIELLEATRLVMVRDKVLGDARKRTA